MRRGLVAGVVMTFMRRKMRERDARELLLMGELVDAQTAMAMGMVNRVVPAASLLDKCHRIASVVMEGGPKTADHTKRLLDDLWPHTTARDVEIAMKHHAVASTSHEAEEGMAAFLEKRLPSWSPRAKAKGS